METIWPYLKITLAAIFLVIMLVLPFMLIRLALLKKKMVYYIDQINKKGKIFKRLDDYSLFFDPLIAAYIFEPLLKPSEKSKYFKYKTVKALDARIRAWQRIVKPIAIIAAAVTIVLVILLNIYGS